MIKGIDIFLIVAILASFIFWLQSFFILYHLIRFGIGTRPKQLALIFFGGSLGLFFLTTVAYFFIDTSKIEKLNQITNKQSTN